MCTGRTTQPLFRKYVGKYLGHVALLWAALACNDHPAGPVDPGPAPDPLIAYTYESAGARSRIGVIKPDGSEQRFITDGTVEATLAAWSPNGQQLSMSYQGIAGRNPQLYSIGLDGTDLRAIPIGTQAGRSSSWAPTGNQVAFDNFYGLFVVNPDGSGLRALLDEEHDNGVPVWSADGAWIAFTGFAPGFGDGASRRLYVVRPDGSGLRRLASTIPQAIIKASWSPDGKHLVFDTSNGNLHLVNVATNDVSALVTTPAIEEHPAWSPDGTRIAFSRRSETGAHIFTVRIDGTDERQVTSGAGSHDWPAWQPLAASR